MAFQVTKVHLPERTRARFEEEGNQQRVLKPHDIRGAIPLVDYTNPAKFPPYIFREYPKMPLLDGNKPVVIDESGGVLVFYDAADEVEFRDLNPELADEIERNTPAKALSEALAAKDAQIEDMRARLRAAGIEDDPKKPKSALAGVVRADDVVSEGAASPPVPGLRETLPKTDDPKTGNPLKKKN